MIHRVKLLLVGLLVAVMMSACGRDAAATNDGLIHITTTIGQITNISQVVGGEHVSVTGLMGPGVDPHLYVASASDVDKLQDADIIFYNGLFLEAQMENVLEQLAERKTVVAVSAGIDRAGLLASPIYPDEYDPHIWFDVTLWMQAVEQVRDTLIEYDAEHAADYEANAAAYLIELQSLHKYVQEQAQRVPESQRVLITAHDAFNYFGRAYSFEVLGLQGISTASEASTADVQELADFIATRQIPAVFVESSVPVRTIEAVQAAVQAKGFDVQIGGQLYSDAMGNADTPAGTYLGMVRHNIDTIVGALLGE
ncbi:MAG: zinc ABC transporter substrate-binding protein [Chloroflexi bacterium]|nr:zinc ABC transporter substrate-binding protein [Chloroflexota bacterium]